MGDQGKLPWEHGISAEKELARGEVKVGVGRQAAVATWPKPQGRKKLVVVSNAGGLCVLEHIDGVQSSQLTQ